MSDPRWSKVLRDLTANRTRSLLVVASIALGIFAVGVVQQLRTVILAEMQRVHNGRSAAHATISARDLDEAILESVRRMPEVAAAEGRNSLSVQVEVAPGEWEFLSVTPIDDFAENRINLLQPLYALERHPDFGAAATRWPDKDEIVLERSSLDSDGVLPAGLNVGDTLRIKREDDRQRDLVVTGVVYDASGFPSAFTGSSSGYVTYDTFERLGGERTYSQILIQVVGTPEQVLDEVYITQIANKVSDKIEKSGRTVDQVFVPTPGELLFQDIFDSLSLLLTPLGVLALFLSGFLVVNTISALMAQQTRQIGVMKAVGATRSQIIIMYMSAILSFSLVALLIAVPVTITVTGALLGFLSVFINIDFPTWTLPLNVLVIQLLVGVIVPLLAAVGPILRGAGVTVREALSDFSTGQIKADLVTALLSRLRGLSEPLQLSLRNTFRRKARLALTLIMLILGGMIFMTVGSVRISLANLIEAGLAYSQFDVQVEFENEYRTVRIEQIAQSIPGVSAAEVWSSALATRIRPDESESDPITISALPAESAMVQPTIVEGRWLLPDDTQSVVISQRLLSTESDVKVGDAIILDIGGKEAAWQVVGIAQILSGPPGFLPAYVNFPYFARYTQNVGRGDSVQIKVDRANGVSPAAMETLLEETYEGAGLAVSSTLTVDRIREISGGFFDIIVYLLSAMGVLIAAVGALGLMGTMSTNVLERTRELGVMRAIGASDGAVKRIVIAEGVLIGLISWLIGAALAFPMGALISSGVGQVLFNVALPYTFSGGGVVTWLIIVAILAALASFLPAWNASRLTVREVLAYE
jgi:putative ABC transport system permease protein